MQTMTNVATLPASQFQQWFRAQNAGAQMTNNVLRAPHQGHPEYERRITEAAELVAGVKKGVYPSHRLQEALSTSDFPSLFSELISRQLLGNYMAYPAEWRAVAREGDVPDFRAVDRYYVDGPTGLMTAVPEGENVPYDNSVTDGEYTYSVSVYEKAIAMTMETMVNDDLGAFNRLPGDLAQSAINTENHFATGLYVDANGPHASLYTAGNNNIVNTTNGADNDNPALSVDGLQDAITVLRKQTDARGMPIYIPAVTLVVPPALEITARNILNATELELTARGGTADGATSGTGGQRVITGNWMRNYVNLVVNPWIPYIANSANGDTSWFLFGNPEQGRPAMEIGFLRGYRNPLVLRKRPDVELVSGGQAPPIGSFDTRSYHWKVMHIFGGVAMDGKVTVASNGSGS